MHKKRLDLNWNREVRTEDFKPALNLLLYFSFNSNLHYMKAKILEYLKEFCDKYIEAPLP